MASDREREKICRAICFPPDFLGCPCRTLRCREQELITLHQVRWRQTLPPGWANWITDFRRGFIAWIECSCQAWINHGPRIVATHPIERVVLTDREPFDEIAWVNADTPRRSRPAVLSRPPRGTPEQREACRIPEAIFRLLPGVPNHANWHDFRPPDPDPRNALNTAALQWARLVAGLDQRLPCVNCENTGSITVPRQRSLFGVKAPCPVCKGTGTVIEVSA